MARRTDDPDDETGGRHPKHRSGRRTVWVVLAAVAAVACLIVGSCIGLVWHFNEWSKTAF